jgi:hypothetical protein
MRMTPIDPDGDRSNVQGTCDECGSTLQRYRGQGDIYCNGTLHRTCHAIYNSFGQRLRDDLNTRRNPSSYDEDIGDMEGNEASYSDY